jgi:hypothetical protein
MEMQTKSDSKFVSTQVRHLALPVLKDVCMLSRFAFSLLLAITLPLAATPLSARSCILSNVASEKACKPGCCANKTCCATSTRNKSTPSQPLTKADSSYKLDATCAALPAAISASREYATELFQLFNTASSGHSPPTLALICIRLI